MQPPYQLLGLPYRVGWCNSRYCFDALSEAGQVFTIRCTFHQKLVGRRNWDLGPPVDLVEYKQIPKDIASNDMSNLKQS